MITLNDLIKRFGEQELANLTDRDSYATIDETVTAHAIADAEAEIESYLNATGLFMRDEHGALIYTYGTPPKGLIIKGCDIARYYLYENGVTDIVEARYKQAIDYLKLIAKNPAMLTGANEKPQSVGGIAVIANQTPNMWKD